MAPPPPPKARASASHAFEEATTERSNDRHFISNLLPPLSLACYQINCRLLACRNQRSSGRGRKVALKATHPSGAQPYTFVKARKREKGGLPQEYFCSSLSSLLSLLSVFFVSLASDEATYNTHPLKAQEEHGERELIALGYSLSSLASLASTSLLSFHLFSASALLFFCFI